MHREVWVPTWGRALSDTVERLTGQRAFRFFTAVTSLKGQVDRWHEWRDDPQVKECLEGNWVGFLRLEDMWRRTLETTTTAPASSVTGQWAQMLSAAGQAHVQRPGSDVDAALSAPHDVDAQWWWASEAAMWLPPPPVADCQGIDLYGNTMLGYDYAGRHYRAERHPEGLRRLLETAPPWPRRSYELLRLEQFYMVRGWHFAGLPESEEEVDAAMHLHQQVQAAWAARRFDRLDVPLSAG